MTAYSFRNRSAEQTFRVKFADQIYPISVLSTGSYIKSRLFSTHRNEISIYVAEPLNVFTFLRYVTMLNLSVQSLTANNFGSNELRNRTFCSVYQGDELCRLLCGIKFLAETEGHNLQNTICSFQDVKVQNFLSLCVLNRTHGQALRFMFAAFDDEVMNTLNI